MKRREFVAALAAVFVVGKGRSVAPHKPRGRELVDAAPPTRPDDPFAHWVIGDGEPILVPESGWMTVRLNGRPVRLLRSRKVPPSQLVELRDGRVMAASGMPMDEIARTMARNRLMMQGRYWIDQDTHERAARAFTVRNLLRP